MLFPAVLSPRKPYAILGSELAGTVHPMFPYRTCQDVALLSDI